MQIGLKSSREMVKGGAIVTRLLAAEGVDKVFGIIDGTYFGMYACFGDHGIDQITPRHESSAVHMAAAYARLTGRLGVCIASNGPGVANALPGVAVEQTEGNRVLLITSSRRHAIVHPDRGGTFQCFPQQQVIAAMAKWSCHVPSADRIAELVRRALRMCFTGRPGLVHIDIPEDLMNGSFEVDPSWFRPPHTYRLTEPMEPSASQVARAVDLLTQAERPLIHVGSGVVHALAFDAVRTLSERLGAMVVTSWAARAGVDERHEQVVPMVYLDAVAKARTDADVVLVLGSRLGETDWWGKKPYWAGSDAQKLIQVDVDAETLGNIRAADLAVQADVGAFLAAVTAAIPGRRVSKTKDAWKRALHKAIRARRKKLDKHLAKTGMPLHSAHVPTVAQRVFGDDAIMVVDGGNTAIWANFYTQVRTPNTIVTTPKMGHLGAGVPHTIAAKVAHPDRPVYCIIGDGAMGFQPQEIETAVRHDLPVVWIVLCDRAWGMVKINQQFALRPIKTLVKGTLDPSENLSTDLGEIAWDDLARSMGAHGERTADPDGLENAMRRAVASGKPAVIHVDVDRVAHLWAPELKAFKDMHAEPAGEEDTMAAPRVLVTGATGHVGSLVVSALAQHADGPEHIVAVDVRAPTTRVEGVHDVTLDITSDALRDCIADHAIDVVVHLAAVVTPRPGQTRQDQYRIDVGGTDNLLQACLAAGVRKLVYTSSGAAYGYSDANDVLLDEDDPLLGNETFAYAWHKRLVEERLAEWRVQHPELQQLVFRPSTILGERMHNQITHLFEQPVVPGIRHVDTPFCFAWDEDVVACIVAGVLGNATGVFNLTGDGVMTLREVAAAMGRRYVSVPEPVLRAALRVAHEQGWTPYGPEQLLFLRHRPVMSNARLKATFGAPLTSRQAFERYRSSRV